MNRRVTSRLARRQQKQAFRQSFLMMGLAIVTAGLFIFVIMPRAIDLFFKLVGGGEVSLTKEDTIPPQVPVIPPPPEATTENRIILAGFGEAESQVVVVVNGNEVDRVAVDGEGKFSYELSLEEGENLIALYGVDQAENESAAKEYVVVLDTQNPTIELENLAEGAEIITKENQNYEIKGSTEAYANLTLNGRSVYVNGEGNFSVNYYLAEGDNTLKFEVTDKAGNKNTLELKVKFRY